MPLPPSSQAYVALLSAPRPDAHVDRLAEVFLPSFMGSPDQVALPGRERGAIFRSTREKEAVLQIWADEVDKRQAEVRRSRTSPLLFVSHC